MTGLLVSVRDVVEARLALEAGVDLIDLKEPRHGSLGAVELSIARETLRVVDGRVPVSMAGGELVEIDSLVVPPGMTFAKLGLAGCARRADWSRLWREAWARVDASCGAVAVIYADWREVEAPEPAAVLQVAQETNCRAILVDTALKNRGRLLDHLSVAAVAEIVEAARSAKHKVVLAGSLDERTAERLLPLSPDYLAVRGAVCRGERTTMLDPVRLAHWVSLVHGGERFALEGSLAEKTCARFENI